MDSASSVLVAIAGGTIINGHGQSNLITQGDIESWLLPELPNIHFQWICDAPSPSLTLPDIIHLASELTSAAKEVNSKKLVVLTGTDAMEEIAFALDLLMPPDLTVVCTGAMQSPDTANFDGILNLNASLAFLQDFEIDGGRTFVSLGGAVMGALGATKMSTSSPTGVTFVDPWKGPAADVADTLEVRHHHPGYERGANVIVVTEDTEATVPIISAALGETADWLISVPQSRLDALVVSAMGTGNTHPRLLANLEPLLSSGLPVLVCSRCLRGCSQPVYRYPGGGEPWESAGAILAGCLSPQKARLLAALAICATGTRHRATAPLIADWVERHGQLCR